EGVLLIRLQPLALPQEVTDLRLRLRHVLARSDLDHDPVDPSGARLVRAKDALVSRGERDQYGIVLVLSPRALPLGSEHANDGERDIRETDDLADRTAVREHVLDDGLAEQRDLRRAANVFDFDRSARGQGPVSHVAIVG